MNGSITVTTGSVQSAGVGGIVGGGGQYTGKYLYQCVNNADITADTAISGIVEYIGNILSSTGTIEACVNNGNLNATGGNAAGICNSGYAGSSPKFLIGCVNNGNIYSTINASGIAGGYFSVVRQCVNHGHVTSSGTTSNFAAGIAQGGSVAQIEECCNFGDVTGNGYTAAIAANQSTDRSITNCLAFGHINGQINRTGAITARTHTTENVINCLAACTTDASCKGVSAVGTGTWINCYWDSTLNPNASLVGTGYSTAVLQMPTSNTGIYGGYTIPPWDFGSSTEYPRLTTIP